MAVVQVFRKNRTVSLEVELKRFEPLISAVHSLHDSLQEVSRACTNPKKLSEKGSERGFDRRFGQYTNAKTARKVSFRCPVRLRCRGVRDFSDSFSRNCLINRHRLYSRVR